MDADAHASDWFLAQVKPNSHAIAARNLARQGFATFLPMQEETRRHRGKFLTQMRPLFAGYIFVALDMRQGAWRAVNSTSGITRLVSLGSAPTPVPRDLVCKLMGRCDQDGRLVPQKPLSPGDEVMLTRGPFMDFVARIERMAPDERVHVLMDLMGAQTRLVVRAQHLRQV
jgi:transcriptional antiterminator RfaH